MRAWKLIGGTGVLGVALIAVVVGRGRGAAAAGNTSDQSPTASPTAPFEDPHEAFTPYDMGPGAIPYEQLNAAEKAAVDQHQENEDTRQPVSGTQAYDNAVGQAATDAQVQIDARKVGLVGVDQQGVVP